VLTNTWKHELQRGSAGNSLKRFRKRDSSRWPAEKHEEPLVKSNLQWLDLPGQIEPRVNGLIECLNMAEQEGLDHFVFVAMGASNLAAILNLPGGNAAKRSYPMDTTDPVTDVAIPGADSTFGDLQLALALREFEALEQAEKRTVRLHPSQLGENSLKQVVDVVIQAVAQIRRLTQAMRD